jgi:hypothetical protein
MPGSFNPVSIHRYEAESNIDKGLEINESSAINTRWETAFWKSTAGGIP